MKAKSKFLPCLLLAATLTLSGCGNAAAQPQEEVITLPTVQATDPVEDPAFAVEDLTIVLEAGEFYTLEAYKNLKNLDLTGSTCYDMILHYIENHPQVNVKYAVDLGGTTVDSHTTSLSLEDGRFTHEALLQNLQYLPELTEISFPGIRLSGEQIGALREAYPEIEMDYTVSLLGSTYPSDTTELDLSALGPEGVSEAAASLGMLQSLQNVQLGSSLSMEDVAVLQDANPNAIFHYSFTLYDKTISTADEEVIFQGLNIGNDGVAQLRPALNILRNCKRFVLDNCKIDNQTLADLREEYRGRVPIVWRVYFGVDGRYNTLTDAEMIRAVYNVTDDTCGPLKYCEGAKYIDMGHNDYLTDLTFVAGMPNLEVFIGSGSAVKELTGFENCKKLVWLELANCLKLTNIDALAGCESLTYLNLSNTKVTSYAPLDGLPLERFKCSNPKASAQERKTFETIHDGCLTVWNGNVYGYGWRYDNQDLKADHFNPYYRDVIRKVFDLDRLEAIDKSIRENSNK